MLFMLCSCICYCVFIGMLVCMLGMFWEGLKHVCGMSFLHVLLDFRKDFCGLFWHYSPLDREEVAMYGGRALVGPQ